MMSQWPSPALPALSTIHPLSLESVGLNTGSVAGSPASAVFPAANRALLVPFHIEIPILVTLLFSVNGSAVSGNIDAGIYSADFRKIVSIGSTAQSGTDTVQTFDITDTQLGPGDFYLAVALDNGTGALYRLAQGIAYTRKMGVLQMASAFPLPATITPAAVAASYLPMFGLRWGGTAI